MKCKLKEVLMRMFNPTLEEKEVWLGEKAVNMHLCSHFWVMLVEW